MLQCRLVLRSLRALRIPDTRLYPATLGPSEGETLPRKLLCRAKFARKWPTRQRYAYVYLLRPRAPRVIRERDAWWPRSVVIFDNLSPSSLRSDRCTELRVGRIVGRLAGEGGEIKGGCDIKSIERVSRTREIDLEREDRQIDTIGTTIIGSVWLVGRSWPLNRSAGGGGEFNRIRFNARNHGGGEVSRSLCLTSSKEKLRDV